MNLRHMHYRDCITGLTLWGNRSLLADLYALSLHGPSEHESKLNMYRQLTTDFLSLNKLNSHHSPFSSVTLIIKDGNTMQQTDYL